MTDRKSLTVYPGANNYVTPGKVMRLLSSEAWRMSSLARGKLEIPINSDL